LKLLLDQNLSYKLVSRLADAYPDSSHVRLLGLERADDQKVYDYAAQNDFVIVSKDDDFYQLSLRYGPPPKIIWLNIGNCKTEEAHSQLLSYADQIVAFHAEPETSYMVIGKLAH